MSNFRLIFMALPLVFVLNVNIFLWLMNIYFFMVNEYIYLENLTSFQREQVENFNKDSKILYNKVSNCEICRSDKINRSCARKLSN